MGRESAADGAVSDARQAVWHCGKLCRVRSDRRPVHDLPGDLPQITNANNTTQLIKFIDKIFISCWFDLFCFALQVVVYSIF